MGGVYDAQYERRRLDYHHHFSPPTPHPPSTLEKQIRDIENQYLEEGTYFGALEGYTARRSPASQPDRPLLPPSQRTPPL